MSAAAASDKIRFICGCLLSLTDDERGIMLDAEGFVICGAHQQRRYGWRSVPYTATTMPVAGMGAWSELEYEQYVLYGKVPKRDELGMTKDEFAAAMAEVASRTDRRSGEEVVVG